MANVNKEVFFQTEKAVQLLHQILDISLLQKQFAEGRGWEAQGMKEFSRLLAKRQKLSEQLDKIVVRDNEKAAAENPAFVRAFQEQQEKCLPIVREIELNDRITRETLEQFADQTASGLAGVRESKKINKAYAKPIMESAWFFDQRK